MSDSEVPAFVSRIIDQGTSVRLREIFSEGRADAVWRVPDRHGVSVIALRTPTLRKSELIDILVYRLAQYLLANQLDPQLIFESRLEHEPESNVGDEDIHFLAGDVSTGELLSYITLKALKGYAGDARLSSGDRPLFPVEEVYGVGVFNRLRILPDLLARRVREAGRFSKNHRPHCLDELTVRAPVEIMLALTRTARGPLMREIDAYIGDLEEGVAKKNHDFFHLPTVLIRGVVPYAAEDSFGFFNYQSRTRYPYALLPAEVSEDRCAAIEGALELPGSEAIAALLALKRVAWNPRSSLEPPGGLAPLTAEPVPQAGVPMSARRERLSLGERLRKSQLFEGLSLAEAAVLGTFMKRCSADSGDTLIRQGDFGDDLCLIESGNAEVQVVGRGGERTVVAKLGPGDCFGEIALVTGGSRTADVVAVMPMTFMRLRGEDYARYLSHIVDVERQVVRLAAVRARDTLRTLESDDD